jgi:hypothetical protein
VGKYLGHNGLPQATPEVHSIHMANRQARLVSSFDFRAARNFIWRQQIYVAPSTQETVELSFFNEQPELDGNDNFTLRYTVFSSAAVIDIRLYSNVHCIVLFEKDCNCNEQKIYSIDERVRFSRARTYGVNGVLNPEQYIQIHRFIYKKI